MNEEEVYKTIEKKALEKQKEAPFHYSYGFSFGIVS